MSRWRHHPHVRSDSDLTVGERAADRMRNGMGSWAFVFGALGFLAVWMVANVAGLAFDRYPFILLNLVLSCLAAMQGAILLIAAKRADQVASELAQHDYSVNMDSLRYHVAVSQLLVGMADRQGYEIDPSIRRQLLAPPSYPLPPVNGRGVV
jgi:uncharacterized membrane protein